MSGVSELPSGEVEFVDSELDEVFEQADTGERVSMLVRPVVNREEFIKMVVEESFGRDCEAVGRVSVVIDLSEEECAVLLDNQVVEAIEVNRPVELLE